METLMNTEVTNPVQSENQMADSQKQNLTTDALNTNPNVEKTPVSPSTIEPTKAPIPEPVSIPVGDVSSQENTNTQDLAEKIRSVRAEIESAHSELAQLRVKNVHLKENLENLKQEKAQLNSQNQTSSSQVSPLSKTPDKPTI